MKCKPPTFVSYESSYLALFLRISPHHIPLILTMHTPQLTKAFEEYGVKTIDLLLELDEEDWKGIEGVKPFQKRVIKKKADEIKSSKAE